VSMIRVGFMIGRQDLADFQAKVKMLECTQSEVLRNLARSWTAFGNTASVVLPLDAVHVLLAIAEREGLLTLTGGEPGAAVERERVAVDAGADPRLWH